MHGMAIFGNGSQAGLHMDLVRLHRGRIVPERAEHAARNREHQKEKTQDPNGQ
jgi:hypothetical protein